MFHDDGYALLIGINDYRAFDHSMNRPEGTSNLAGSVLDAHMFWRLCVQLGMKPENLRVAVSPRPDLGLLPGATADNLVEATEAGLRGAIGWLADALAGGRAGLLTYSGHGAHTSAQGLLLCPGDTTGANFAHAIPFVDLRSALGDGAQHLTVVLDCCHAATTIPTRGRRPSTLGGDAVPVGERADEMLIGARVLAACRPGETTQQASFGGAPHGAFSWALGAVLEQWQPVGEGPNVRLDLSYGTLVDRARQLLAVLDFAGTPTLYGPPDVGALAVMQTDPGSQQTSAVPDGARTRVQMDPGQKQLRVYTLRDGTGSLVAKVLVAREAGTLKRFTYQTGTEYWCAVSTSTPQRSLHVTWKDHDWGDPELQSPGARSFTMVQAASWGPPGRSEPPTGETAFASETAEVALRWELTLGTQGWEGSLKWYNTTGQSNVFSGPMPAGGVTLDANPSYPPGGSTWCEARVEPEPVA